MLKPAFVQPILDAFLSLFTQPFDQDLKASRTAAVTAISLPWLPGFALANSGSHTASEIGGFSLLLVLVWVAMTAIVTKPERQELVIARNVSVVSFWIAATLLFIIAVESVFTDPLDRAIRLLSVYVVLLVCVPLHVFRNLLRNLRIGLTFLMTLALWLSTCALAWRIIY